MGGAGRIPWTAIDRYAVRHGIDDLDAFDRLVTLVGAADGERLRQEAEAAKDKGKRRGKG